MTATPREDTDLVVPAPAGRRRRWVSLVIALFLLVQAVIPATYYLSTNQNDGRFCWRMFSTVRVHQVIHAKFCTVNVRRSVEEGGHLVDRPVDIESMLPRVWIASLTRS
jgi:hypothetical protein